MTITRAETLLASVTAALDAGRTVTFATCYKAVKITPRNRASWARSGHDLFKIQGDHLCVARGKNYDSVMGCRVTAE